MYDHVHANAVSMMVVDLIDEMARIWDVSVISMEHAKQYTVPPASRL